VHQVCDASVGLQIAEEVSQGLSADMCDSNNREMRRRHTNKLGDIPVKSIFYGLHRGTGQGKKFPVCMVVNVDSISGLEGVGRHTVSINYEQTMFGSEIR
jgi:hypothetical protein